METKYANTVTTSETLQKPSAAPDDNTTNVHSSSASAMGNTHTHSISEDGFYANISRLSDGWFWFDSTGSTVQDADEAFRHMLFI